ncbi:hypothetical protein JW879_10780 [candidate division WOR-3 bacterium]|nr:hypothetical protein [candidate division WOR-3 bacterium]
MKKVINVKKEIVADKRRSTRFFYFNFQLLKKLFLYLTIKLRFEESTIRVSNGSSFNIRIALVASSLLT